MGDYAALELDTRLRRLYPTRLPIMTRCPAGEVIVRVAYAGICHTDLAILQGDFQIDCDRLVLGHEISGIVSGVGKEVNWLRIGDKVAVNPNRLPNKYSAGTDEIPDIMIKASVTSIVEPLTDIFNSSFVSGIFPKNLKMAKVTPQYKKGDKHEAENYRPVSVLSGFGVLCESLSCVAHAWEHVTPLPHSARVAVLGTDLVGCLTASLLHVQGYRHVTLCENAEAARQRAHSLGLGYDMIDHNELCNKTFDLAIDCTGDAMIQQEAAHALGFGGHLLIFRSNSVKDRLCLSPFNIFTNEIKVTGSLINPYAFGKALTWASVLGHRYLDFNKLGVVSYPLKEYQEALETAKSDDAAKVVFEFDVSDVPTP
ncbi:D-altritol 5-dehydrogenase-like [Schistocerca piceifrons]|uniref:D-altritol 5-dehydrogenase-like n=1 Tax=Schistocerca piceifrons TaxID=274613 RepID=UPI001F5F2CC4|nr:D-altritol 5-dehydrogenase-like [Schistocerca piceifrons]